MEGEPPVWGMVVGGGGEVLGFGGDIAEVGTDDRLGVGNVVKGGWFVYLLSTNVRSLAFVETETYYLYVVTVGKALQSFYLCENNKM